ncbi:MAG TPA: DUF222 domain-containing protein [Actinomycetota bacterium]|nr:DUF222 domain-containing protein [Actinomycetota bacterium]
MSTLRSVCDELRIRDLRTVSDDELASYLDDLEHTDRFVDAERARALAELERREVVGRDGHLSLGSWMVARHGVAPSTAAGHVRMARALEQMPVTADALAGGEVSSAAVSLLASAQEAAPEHFARAEDALVDAARTLPVTQLRSTVARWRENADSERAAEDEERRFERRRLHVSATLDGMVRLDGELDPLTGQTVITALRAVEDANVRSREGHRSGEQRDRSAELDPRTPGQRRADALGEICRQWLDLPERPVVSGERPHVVVTMDLASLERRAGHRVDLEDVGRIDGEAARQLACDATVSRVITVGSSQPLDVGRKSKVVPPALRRAVAVRDGGCAFPSCDRPSSWCDAHHVHHWADGGPTSLDNLVLLCRRHHRLVHHRRFTVEMTSQRPRFFRADGTGLDRGG